MTYTREHFRDAIKAISHPEDMLHMRDAFEISWNIINAFRAQNPNWRAML